MQFHGVIIFSLERETKQNNRAQKGGENIIERLSREGFSDLSEE